MTCPIMIFSVCSWQVTAHTGNNNYLIFGITEFSIYQQRKQRQTLWNLTQKKIWFQLDLDYCRFWEIYFDIKMKIENLNLKLIMIEIENTQNLNCDKPYDWGLETLTGKTYVKNNLFSGGRIFVSKENLKSKFELDLGICHYW